MSGFSDLVSGPGHFFHLNVAFGSFLQFVHSTRIFLHRLFPDLPGHRERNMECNATSRLSFQIWIAMRLNLSMNFWRDSSSVCHTLAKAIDVIQCDRLVAYCKLKCSTRVLKLSMDLGGSPSYQVNATPLRDVGKTRHKIASSLVHKFTLVRKASICSSGSVVPLYCSRLGGFQPRGMSTSMIRLTKGCRRVVRPVGWYVWEILGLS